MHIIMLISKPAVALALCATACFSALSTSAEPLPNEQHKPPSPAEPAANPGIHGFGAPLASHQLAGLRGGFETVNNDMQLSGSVANNSAAHVASGNNYIADGSFSNMTGLPVTIQNSGSNVLIQNATIVNVQFQ